MNACFQETVFDKPLSAFSSLLLGDDLLFLQWLPAAAIDGCLASIAYSPLLDATDGCVVLIAHSRPTTVRLLMGVG